MKSFDEIYKAFGLKYFIEPAGKLDSFKDESFDIIVSAGALEHMPSTELTKLSDEFYRLLKPGGYTIHSINLTDHLYLYDKSVSPKKYLMFSDTVWESFFENKVQYFNRVQRPEWLNLFKKSGFELIEEDSEYIDIGTMKTNKKYANISKKDLNCISLDVVHRK